MRVMGLVFSNIHDQSLPEMTRWRTIASVPIASRYRMVDFVLSNMVNSGIMEVGIITKTKYNSLMKHVGSGRDWDLDRKHGGVSIISPYVEAGSGALYTNRLEAMINSIGSLESSSSDLVLLTDCDILANIPLKDIVERHIESGADVTAVFKRMTFDTPKHMGRIGFELDGDNRVVNVTNLKEISGTNNISMNIWVLNRTLLINILRESSTYGFRSFSKDVLPRQIKRINVKGYEFNGYTKALTDLNQYFEANMDVLKPDIRRELFGNVDYPVYTKVKDSAPTKYGDKAQVKNSLISDGCIIEGTVENSVLFRGVRVDEGAVIKNSVILNDSIIENNASMDYIIMDKRAIARRNRVIAGCEGHPFFIGRDEVL